VVTNLTEAKEEEETLLMTVQNEDAMNISVVDVVHSYSPTMEEHVFLNEEPVYVELRRHANDTDSA
jgi:hypothetical protein